MSELKLTADSGGGSVSLKGPASTTSNAAVQLTLPQNDGDASQFLQTNGSGALTWAAAGGGLDGAHIWRVTAEFTGDAQPITSNWEQDDSTGAGRVGTVMSESSGVFTFPSTGIWYLEHTGVFYNAGSEDATNLYIQVTENDGTAWTTTGDVWVSQSTGYFQAKAATTLDCTDTSTHKVRFGVNTTSGSTSYQTSSTVNKCYVMFLKLGET